MDLPLTAGDIKVHLRSQRPGLRGATSTRDAHSLPTRTQGRPFAERRVRPYVHEGSRRPPTPSSSCRTTMASAANECRRRGRLRAYQSSFIETCTSLAALALVIFMK